MSTITRTHDPIIDVTNNRVTWHLPNDTILSPDIKMLNIGAFVEATVREYNRYAGGLSLIKNIYLTSNGVTIDQLLDANSWVAFQESNKSHSEAESLSRNLIGNALGLIVDDNAKIGRAYLTKPVSTTLAASGKCMISLGDLLPFLRSSSIVPTTIFQNLRITIEYDTSVAVVTTDNRSTLTAMSTPFLVVEEILDADFIQKATADYRGLGFMSIERDQMFCSTTKSAGGDFTDVNELNTQSLESRSFQNKYVSRLVVAPKSLDARAYLANTNDVAGGGTLGAISLLQPKFNVVVNGSNKVAGQGLVGSTEIAARLIDTWGVSCTPTGAYGTNVFDQDGFYTDHGAYCGYMGWMGLSINEFVQSLYLNFEYTAQAASDVGEATNQLFARFNSDYNMLCFAECRKSIIVRPDKSFMVSYM